MTDGNPLYQVGADEKVAHVMAYTSSNILWGEIVVKQAIRVSTWLRTNVAPDSFCLFNAKALNITAPAAAIKPLAFPELHIPSSMILGFHLLPPEKDPVDFDPTERNRKMEPITVLLSTFRIDGFLRMSTQLNLAKHLDISRETFTGIYDVEIHNPLLPALGVMRVPYLLVRQSSSIITTRITS